MTRRRIKFLSGIATALALACAPTIANAQQTLRAALHSDLKIVDPIWTTALISTHHGNMVYDTLFAMDDKLQVKPQMVDKWEVSPDKLTWTFTLRDGLKWHDGAPVTSDDVIASLTRWSKNDSMGQALAAATQEWKKVDDKTFQLVLKEPFGLVLDSIGKPSSNTPFIMPKRVAESPPNKAIAEHAPNAWHIGSGPFKFVIAEFQPGTKVVYEKNADYVPRKEKASWMAGGKVVKVDRVEWINVGDPQTTVNALIKGEIDYIEQPVHDLFPALKKSPDIVLHDYNKMGLLGWMRLNWLAPPFNNEKVRQAVLLAVQQEDYLAVLVGDPEYYKYCASFFTCGTTYESTAGAPDMKKPNIEKAKQLLKEGGYKGEEILILHPTDLKAITPYGPVTEQALKKIGMNVKLLAMDWASVVARRSKQDPPAQGGWHIFHTFWVGADLLNPLTNAGMNAKGPKGGFFGWPEDPEMEKMRAAFVKETDPGKQKAIAEAITKRGFETVMYVPIGQMQFPAAYRKSLTGVLDGPVPVFWNVEKK